ncbi:hypothetical protein BYT27DRAFT_7251451 [Phlegmacium glaucopus]|nr:hypothetical protein BYT27DRAFT_7251451 [Phlegmacium glaucopus]
MEQGQIDSLRYQLVAHVLLHWALIVCLLTCSMSGKTHTGNRPELILSTIAACSGVFTSLIGWSGILLNNRSFLAWYTFLTWITFAFLVAPGYVICKRPIDCEFKTDYNAVVISVPSLKLPSVKPVMREVLHQDVKRLRKGMMAEDYRLDINMIAVIMDKYAKFKILLGIGLDINTTAVIMDNYANQLAEQYGADITSNTPRRTRSKSVLGTNTINASTPLDSILLSIPQVKFTPTARAASQILNTEDEH